MKANGTIGSPRMSAMDLWREGIGLPCHACGSRRIVLVVRTFYPTIEAAHRFPDVAALLISKNIADGGPGKLPTVRLRSRKDDKEGEDYTLISTVAACSRCRRELEMAAAHSPHSWAVVELDRGPGPGRPLVAVC